MERKEWTVHEFVQGTNKLPEGFHWNVVTGDKPVVQVSLELSLGNAWRGSAKPKRTNHSHPTNWDGLIRFAVQIAHMAQAIGVRLPDGVLVKVTH